MNQKTDMVNKTKFPKRSMIFLTLSERPGEKKKVESNYQE